MFPTRSSGPCLPTESIMFEPRRLTCLENSLPEGPNCNWVATLTNSSQETCWEISFFYSFSSPTPPCWGTFHQYSQLLLALETLPFSLSSFLGLSYTWDTRWGGEEALCFSPPHLLPLCPAPFPSLLDLKHSRSLSESVQAFLSFLWGQLGALEGGKRTITSLSCPRAPGHGWMGPLPLHSLLFFLLPAPSLDAGSHFSFSPLWKNMPSHFVLHSSSVSSFFSRLYPPTPHPHLSPEQADAIGASSLRDPVPYLSLVCLLFLTPPSVPLWTPGPRSHCWLDKGHLPPMPLKTFQSALAIELPREEWQRQNPAIFQTSAS